MRFCLYFPVQIPPLILQGSTKLTREDIERVFVMYDRVSPFIQSNKGSDLSDNEVQGDPSHFGTWLGWLRYLRVVEYCKSESNQPKSKMWRATLY